MPILLEFSTKSTNLEEHQKIHRTMLVRKLGNRKRTEVMTCLLC